MIDLRFGDLPNELAGLKANMARIGGQMSLVGLTMAALNCCATITRNVITMQANGRIRMSEEDEGNMFLVDHQT